MKKKLMLLFAAFVWANTMHPFITVSAESMYQGIVQEIAEIYKHDSDSDIDQREWIRHVISKLQEHRDWSTERIIETYYLNSCIDPFDCFGKIERAGLRWQIKKYDAVIQKLKVKCVELATKAKKK